MSGYKLLFVCKSKSLFDKTALLLKDNNCAPVYAESVDRAREIMKESCADIVIVDGATAGGAFGFAADMADGYPCAVMIMVSGDNYKAVYDKACAHGVFTLKKPIKPDAFLTAVDWLKAAFCKLKRKDESTIDLNEKVKEIKLIDRAKWTLITVLKMTETDAHRYIEKQAMNRCVTKKLIAEEILQTYK